MTQPRFRMGKWRVIFIHCLYLAKLNPVLSIEYIAQMEERRNDNLDIAGLCWFEPAVRHYFCSNNVRLLAYVYTVWDPQLEWLKRNESNRVNTGSDNVLIFIVFVSCLRVLVQHSHK